MYLKKLMVLKVKFYLGERKQNNSLEIKKVTSSGNALSNEITHQFSISFIGEKKNKLCKSLMINQYIILIKYDA